jgi:hypothetical protein
MVTSDDVLKFRNQLEDEGRAPLTVNLMIKRVLKRAFRIATEEGLIGRNPCATVRPIRDTGKLEKGTFTPAPRARRYSQNCIISQAAARAGFRWRSNASWSGLGSPQA